MKQSNIVIKNNNINKNNINKNNININIKLSRNIAAVLLLLLIQVLSASSQVAHAQAVPQKNPFTFTFKGTLAKPDGSAVMDTVRFLFRILPPATNDCILYEELSDAQNLSLNEGRFAVSVGTVATSSRRQSNDYGLDMWKIFNNDTTSALRPSTGSSGACPSGYTPAAGDRRRLRVIVIDSSNVPDIMTPDQIFDVSPFAINAITLQGKTPSQFFEVTTASKATLQDLINGVSSLYLKQSDSSSMLQQTTSGGLTYFDAGSKKISNVSNPASNTDAVNKIYADTKLAGQTGPDLSTTALKTGSDGKVLKWDNNNNKWDFMAIPVHATTANSGCTSGNASRWDGTAWSCVSVGGVSTIMGGAETHSALFEDIVLTSASSRTQVIEAGAHVKLPSHNTLSLGGPQFTFFNKSDYEVGVVNAGGSFLGGIKSHGTAQVYLVSLTGGVDDWQVISSTESHYGQVNRSVPSGYNASYIYGLNGSKWDRLSSSGTISRYIYVVDWSDGTNSNFGVQAQVVEVDTSTTPISITWKNSPFALLSGLGYLSQAQIDWVKAIDANKVLVQIGVQIYLLTVDGSYNVASPTNTTRTYYCGDQGIVRDGYYYCWSYTRINKYGYDGTNITEFSSDLTNAIRAFETIDSTSGIVILDPSTGGDNAYAQRIGLSTLAVSGGTQVVDSGVLKSSNSDNIYLKGSGQALTYPLGGGSFLLLQNTKTLSDGLLKLYKITYASGSISVAAAVETLKGGWGYFLPNEYFATPTIYYSSPTAGGGGGGGSSGTEPTTASSIYKRVVTTPSTPYMSVADDFETYFCHQGIRIENNRCLIFYTESSMPAVKILYGR